MNKSTFIQNPNWIATLQRKINCIILVLLAIVLTGCNPGSEEIGDLIELQQNHNAYLDGKHISYQQVPYKYHKLINQSFDRKHYRPWAIKRTTTSKKALINHFNRTAKKGGFAENKIRYTADFFTEIKRNARLPKYPNYIRKAITINNTNLRSLPTLKPLFKRVESELAGGFPFDLLQTSSLAANTPIQITHISKDNAWVYAHSPIASGWLPIRDIAYAGPKFRREFQKQKAFVALTSEDIPILSSQGHYLYNANIGILFPKVGETKTHYIGYAAFKNTKRQAVIRKIKLSKKVSHTKPLPITIKNIAKLSNELLGQPYGWGGLYRNRDCSAMIRDLFVPFGLWLPRNSTSQAQRGGVYIDLKSLDSETKQEMIIANSTPYLTLLWLPGHIMLYIGEKDGNALIFHNIWGLRTTDVLGRKIIGKSVITTLEPGKELKKIDNKKNLLQRIEGMTILVPRFQT